MQLYLKLYLEGFKMPGNHLDVPVLTDFRLPEGCDLTITFGAHASAADLGSPEVFGSALEATDIFAPEVPGWNGASLDAYNKVARGNLSTRQKLLTGVNARLDHGYGKAIVDGLYWHGRTVKVAFLDIPRGSLSESLFSVTEKQAELLVRWLPFDRVVDGMHELLVQMSVLNIRRENYILENMATNIQQAIASNPRLRNRSSVKIWMLMGAYHAAMGEVILNRQRKVGMDSFSYTQEIHPGCEYSASKAFTEAYRFYGDNVRSEFAARVIAEEILRSQILASETEPTGTQFEVAHKSLQAMTMDDLRGFYEQTRKEAKA